MIENSIRRKINEALNDANLYDYKDCDEDIRYSLFVMRRIIPTLTTEERTYVEETLLDDSISSNLIKMLRNECLHQTINEVLLK